MRKEFRFLADPASSLRQSYTVGGTRVDDRLGEGSEPQGANPPVRSITIPSGLHNSHRSPAFSGLIDSSSPAG